MSLFANAVVGQALEHGPQVLNCVVDAIGLYHEEVVVSDHGGNQAHVNGHDVNLTGGGQEEHVLIGPDDGAGQEATQSILCDVLERNMRKAEEVHKVLTQANQQDERANERGQEPDDGEEVQGQGVAEPGDEPDNAVLREVGDDQQLREGNVEHAEYEEGTDGSRVPLQYEGNRNCEKQHQRHGHEEEVNPVAAERGQVAFASARLS